MFIRKLFVYRYATRLGCVIFPDGIWVSIGEQVTVDFENQEIAFGEGAWKRPKGEMTFLINSEGSLGDLAPSPRTNDVAMTQLAFQR